MPSVHVSPPSVEYSHVASASRPLTFTVPLLVILSVASLPVSSASSRVGASGAVVSTVVEPVVGSLSLPAWSLIVASTSSVLPSSGAGTLTVTSPLLMSSSVNSVSLPLTTTVSPSLASLGRPTVTSTLPSPSISSSVINSSPLPIDTVGASGGLASPVMVSLSDALPEGSLAVTS